jgi:hypothetical protein
MMPNMPVLLLAESTAQPFNLSPDGKWVDLSAVSWGDWHHVSGGTNQFLAIGGVRAVAGSKRAQLYGNPPTSFGSHISHIRPRRYNVLFIVQTPLPKSLTVAKVKADAGQILCQDIPFDGVPARTGMAQYPWEFNSYHKGRGVVRVNKQDRQILLNIYADLLEHVLSKLRPTARDEVIDIPNLDE